MKTSNHVTLILSSADIQQVVRHVGPDELMDSLIARLISAFRNFSPENTCIPARSGFNYENPANGLVEWMPLHSLGEEVMIKLVGYHPANPIHHQLPTILSTVSCYDTQTGHLTGLMDGVLLTAFRTGAASAVASRYMGHPDSKVLGLLGNGAQAVTQLHALSRVFDFEKVLIYDKDPSATASFAGRCSCLNLDLDIEVAALPAVVAGSDILVTATSIEVGAGPLFDYLETKPHLHINAVGSDFPGKIELPLSFLKNSFVCPDFLDQAVVEGECQQLDKKNIGLGIVEVVKNPDAFDFVKKQRSVFDSTGWALEDQVAMELFMEYAQDLGLGQEIEIEYVPQDAKNPYHFLIKNNGIPHPHQAMAEAGRLVGE
jgi:L-lysine cyclodeaminase